MYAATSHVDGIAIFAPRPDEVEVVGVADEPGDFGSLKAPDELFDGPPADWPRAVGHWRDVFTKLADEYAAGDIRIDERNTTPAEGEFAMLTRVYGGNWKPKR